MLHWLGVIIVLLLVVGIFKSCTSNTRDNLKQITQSLSDYSSTVDIKIEMGTWGNDCYY